jgi:hypothetical protein
MKDLLMPALLRLAPYIASFVFGLIGAFIHKLGLGVYDEVAGTITLSKAMFEGIVYSALAGGGIATVAVLMGWKSRKSESS